MASIGNNPFQGASINGLGRNLTLGPDNLQTSNELQSRRKKQQLRQEPGGLEQQVQLLQEQKKAVENLKRLLGLGQGNDQNKLKLAGNLEKRTARLDVLQQRVAATEKSAVASGLVGSEGRIDHIGSYVTGF